MCKGHGLSNTPEYYRWKEMKKRCYNPNAIYYKYYGGRGVRVCDEWLNSPEVFIKWCRSNGYSKGLQLDRIDNDGDYTPNNCRFVTSRENSLNKSNNSKYPGTYLHKSRNKYQSGIKVEGTRIHLGFYKDQLEAHLVYLMALQMVNIYESENKA